MGDGNTDRKEWEKYIIETLKDITYCSIVENVVNKTVTELKEEIERINTLVVTDELTGCFNRRYLNERLQVDLTQSIEREQKLAVAMLDIDYFKGVNDTYGHLIGDYVLREIAEVIKKNIEDAWVSRYGGEEFLIVFRNKRFEEVIEMVEIIRKEVANRSFTYNGHQIRITLSAGLVEYTPQIGGKNQLIEVADAKLYSAKELGRNQVIY